MAATFGAFFVSQKLKNAESVAEYTKLRHYFSPNGDGVRDRDRITFKVEKADRLTVTVVNLAGDRVRRLATGVDARPERPVTVVWDGRSDDGIRAPDGRYRLQVGLRRTGRTVTIPGAFNVDTTAPKPVVVSVKPATAGPVAGAFQIHARRVGSLRAPRFRILRTDLGSRRRWRASSAARAASAPNGTARSTACPRRPGSTWSSSASATRPATSAPRPPCCRRFPARSAASRASPSVSSRRSRPWWRCAPANASRSTSTRATAPTAGTSAGWAAARSRRAARRRGSGRSCCARPAAPPASTCSRSAPAARGRACRSSCSRPSGRSCSSSSRRRHGSASTRSTTTATACPTRSRTAARWSGRGPTRGCRPRSPPTPRRCSSSSTARGSSTT